MKADVQEAALDIRGLRKTYPGGLQALKGIDLRVPRGMFYGLLGPNGAGKSTTIGVLASLVRPSEGEVRICGYDLRTQSTAAKCMLGLVPQEINFNVWERVCDIVINQGCYYGMRRRESRARADMLLAELDLADKATESARNLSGGMKRRLMIARALINSPQLLILDEPTAGVDIEIRRHMWTFLRHLNEQEGTTIILTTHYLEEAEALCERIAIIDQGEIIDEGQVSELLSRANSEFFVLDIDRELQEAPAVSPATVTLSAPAQLHLEQPRGSSLSQTFAALQASGIEVLSMRPRSNRLEEYFMARVRNGGKA